MSSNELSDPDDELATRFRGGASRPGTTRSQQRVSPADRGRPERTTLDQLQAVQPLGELLHAELLPVAVLGTIPDEMSLLFHNHRAATPGVLV